MTEFITKREGAIERTYAVPDVTNLPLKGIALASRAIRARNVVNITFDRGVVVNGEQINAYDLVRFCDAVLATYTGEELERAREMQ